jgi:hypothetical protein
LSVVEVERFVRDVHRLGKFTAFEADRRGFLGEYELTDSELEAVVGNDYGGLYAMGVHPMAVLFYSQDNKEPMASYLATIGAVGDRVDQFRTLFDGAKADQTTSG